MQIGNKAWIAITVAVFAVAEGASVSRNRATRYPIGRPATLICPPETRRPEVVLPQPVPPTIPIVPPTIPTGAGTAPDVVTVNDASRVRAPIHVNVVNPGIRIRTTRDAGRVATQQPPQQTNPPITPITRPVTTPTIQIGLP